MNCYTMSGEFEIKDKKINVVMTNVAVDALECCKFFKIHREKANR